MGRRCGGPFSKSNPDHHVARLRFAAACALQDLRLDGGLRDGGVLCFRGTMHQSKFVSGAVSRGALLFTALFALAMPSQARAQGEIALDAAAAATRAGGWAVASESGATGGGVVRHRDAGAGKISTALAQPAHYFELTFQAAAGTPYRLWIRGRAQSDHWGNDSIFVQFDRSVTSSGSSTYRIGTTSATEVNLEECNGCGLSGWAWQDNGYGRNVLGPTIRFASSGTQRIRVQTREDGLSIDQILLSSKTYLSAKPGGSSGSPADIVLQASSASARAGRWSVSSDSSAIGGAKIRHPNSSASKITRALASPSNYFELTFTAQAGVPYRLWLHGRADGDDWANDSVFVQFSGSVTSSGSSTYRIGTTSATEVNLEECSGCGLSGWTWQDNGWGRGVLGPTIYFASTGTQRIRVQTREDGLAIDRILLSPSTYLRTAPPATGGTTSSTQPATSSPTPAPAPSTTSSTLKVLDWNIHHGVGTDGVYNITRIADWIVKTGANVVSLNEVERNTGWGNEDQPARFAALLRSKTGKTWYYNFAQRSGTTNGQGNLLLTTFPIESDGDFRLSYDRSVSRIAIIVNGIRVNVYSTHLDSESSSRRSTQMRELRGWADNYPEQRILAGDYNAWPGAGEIDLMTSGHYDAWAVAQQQGDAVAYSGNTAGNTRNSRIDYVFYSKGASRLRLRETRVFDTRDSRGVMPSDHRPLMATFDVK
jgi:endonuclease/exonuclease/phosphatase family metal-dependent hydrolase